MNTSANSISFVITAIYTYTFANAVYRILQFNEAAKIIEVRPGTDPVNVMCVFVCLAMALRFFFGNNSYVDDLYRARHSPSERLFHLTVIVLQSLVLLGSSYLIQNPPVFFAWIAALFFIELAWYGGCIVFIRSAVTENGKLATPLLQNEVANFFMALGASAGWILWSWKPWVAAVLVGVAFTANTIVDATVNLRKYMGADEPGSTSSSGGTPTVSNVIEDCSERSRACNPVFKKPGGCRCAEVL